MKENETRNFNTELDQLLNPESKKSLAQSWKELWPRMIVKNDLDFHKISALELHHATPFMYGYNLEWRYHWTPLLQLVSPTEEFLEFLQELLYEYEADKELDFNFKKNLSERVVRSTSNISSFSKTFLPDQERLKLHRENMLELVEAFIQEAAESSGFSYQKDYLCAPMKGCRTHGVLDFVLYDHKCKEEAYGFPLVPIVCPTLKICPIRKKMVYSDDLSPVGAVAKWFLDLKRRYMKKDKEFEKLIKSNPEFEKQHIIFTNGHFWRLYEFNLGYNSRHTSMFRPKSVAELKMIDPNGFDFCNPKNLTDRKIWYDFEMVQLALGILRFGMGVRTSGEVQLKQTYDYIRDRRYMDRIEDEDRKNLEKRDMLRKYLPDWVAERITKISKKD